MSGPGIATVTSARCLEFDDVVQVISLTTRFPGCAIMLGLPKQPNESAEAICVSGNLGNFCLLLLS